MPGELVADPPDEVTTLLRRFSGTRQAVIGRLHLRASDGGVAKHRCRGCRIGGPTPPGEGVLLLVRLESAAHGQFRALTEKIVALNAEIRRAKRTQLQLEMDIRLHGPVDGVEAARAIVDRLGIQSLFVSADTDPGTIARTLAARPLGWVPKPFTEAEMLQAVQAALSTK